MPSSARIPANAHSGFFFKIKQIVFIICLRLSGTLSENNYDINRRCFLVAITTKEHSHSTNNINLILTLIDINANLQLVVLESNLTIGAHKVNE